MNDSAELVLLAYGGDHATQHPLPRTGRVTIGRADDNDVPIPDTAVSRHHCALHVGSQLRLEDLGGANSTYVRRPASSVDPQATHNLEEVSRDVVDIAVGDSFTVGSTVLVVRRAAAAARSASQSGDSFVVCDPGMRLLYEQADRAAQALINVLLLGETGVGKEVLAHAIHDRSPRAKGPFVSLNCAALSESLLESELFGHEKGAFTGAITARRGLFESADGGTVFLDEVGELPPSIQVKLLRVLEERRVLSVGGRTSKSIDVRFIAATNRDLEQEVARGTFREDLYFRLNGFSLLIPPLRERVGEIEPLALLFMANVCNQLDRRDVMAIAPEVLLSLQQHTWRGNVRELRNIIERAVVLCLGDVVRLEHLPPSFFGSPPASGAKAPVSSPISSPAAPPSAVRPATVDSLQGEIQTLERTRIVAALEACAGNQTRAAEILGVSRRTLATWLGRHSIPRPRKKADGS